MNQQYDDPVHRHEMSTLADLCRSYLTAFDSQNELAAVLLSGMIASQVATIWKLAEPENVFDPAVLFTHPGERVIRVKEGEGGDEQP